MTAEHLVITQPNVAAGSGSSAFFPTRTVARPVANLGNTCYMNAVLQALAHAPELCLAMDCQPHSVSCPIAAANNVMERARHQQLLNKQLIQSRQLQQSKQVSSSSPSSSPDGTAAGTTRLSSTSSINHGLGLHTSGSGAIVGTRKSRRTGRKSPKFHENCDGIPSAGGCHTDGITGVASNSGKSDGNGYKFCALCEIEQHLRIVHDASFRDRPVAPEKFVQGFFDDVAPWFKLGVQEDSHEFLRLLIDAMQKSCKKARNVSHPHMPKTRDGTVISDTQAKEDKNCFTVGPLDNCSSSATDSFISNVKNYESSPPSKEANTASCHSAIVDANATNGTITDSEYPFYLFRGTVESKVVCNHCNATSSTLDPIEDVGLEVTAPEVNCNETVSRSSRNSLSGGFGPSGTSGSCTNVTSQSCSSSCLLDVQTAFQRFASTEALDSGYKCENCGKVGRATKQSRLASIPPILTLHLKRFRYGGADSRTAVSGGSSNMLSGTGSSNSHYVATPRTTRSTRASEVSQLLGTSDYFGSGKSGSAKIEGHVKFDPVFDLRPYLTQALQDQHANMFCRLFAVVVHAGKNSHSGHYIAFVRNVAKNEWFKMDDSRISPVTLSEVLNAEAYMLFYRVVQHPISTMLEELHQKNLIPCSVEPEQETKTERSAVESVNATSPDESTDFVVGPQCSGKRKRSNFNVSEQAEEWFRTKTRIPSHLIGVICKSQQLIANQIQLTPSFYQKLCSDAELASSIPSSPCSIINDDIIVGGTDLCRQKLMHLFHRLEQRHKLGVTNSSAPPNGDVSQSERWFVLPQASVESGNSQKEIDNSLSSTITDSNCNAKNVDVKSSIPVNSSVDIDNQGFVPSSTTWVVVEDTDDSVGLL